MYNIHLLLQTSAVCTDRQDGQAEFKDFATLAYSDFMKKVKFETLSVLGK